jgi:MiaB/RimO family radical SAM methylthiotransferase
VKVFVKGLNACMTRRQEIQEYKEYLKQCGHEIVGSAGQADTVLLWTCGYRSDFRDSSLKTIRKYARMRSRRLVVAGCLPDIAPEMVKRVFKGDIVPWRRDSKKLDEIFGVKGAALENCQAIFAEKKICEDAATYRHLHPGADVTFPDQFNKIVVSRGCGYRCSYCSERLMFPAYRSVPEDELVRACRRIVEASGTKDVILVADSLGEYGRDLKTNLPHLIRSLRKIDPKLRVALNNLNTGDFLRYFKQMEALLRQGAICHLNLPIQSASDRILKKMRRPYARKDLEKVFSMLRRLGFTAYDTHVITGFPGETEADVKTTMEFLLKYKPRYVLISRYMETPRTPAAAFPGKVPVVVAKRRLARMAATLGRAGVICNVEGGALARGRIKRLS